MARENSEKDRRVKERMRRLFSSTKSSEGKARADTYRRYHAQRTNARPTTAPGVRMGGVQPRPATQAGSLIGQLRMIENAAGAQAAAPPPVFLGPAGGPDGQGRVAPDPALAALQAAQGGPPPIDTAAPAGGAEGFLGMELAALGGGPEKDSYLRPFDEAEQRVRSTYTQALPDITRAYDELRTRLGAGQQQFSAEQAQIASEQQARMAQLAEKVKQLQGPAGADLAAQSGGSAAPSLTAGVNAQAASTEANLADAQRRQQAFLENLARTGEQSASSRLASTHTAQQAATGNATQNLNTILSQLGLQKANAEARYQNDRADHDRQVAGTKISAMKEAARARQDEAKEAAAAEKEIQGAYKKALATNAPVYDFAREHPYLKTAPATTKAFTDLMASVKEGGAIGKSQALGLLNNHQNELTQKQKDKDGVETTYLYGRPINPEFLRKMIDEYYAREDELVQRYL